MNEEGRMYRASIDNTRYQKEVEQGEQKYETIEHQKLECSREGLINVFDGPD